jgi:hypothetical protein
MECFITRRVHDEEHLPPTERVNYIYKRGMFPGTTTVLFENKYKADEYSQRCKGVCMASMSQHSSNKIKFVSTEDCRGSFMSHLWYRGINYGYVLWSYLAGNDIWSRCNSQYKK